MHTLIQNCPSEKNVSCQFCFRSLAVANSLLNVIFDVCNVNTVQFSEKAIYRVDGLVFENQIPFNATLIFNRLFDGTICCRTVCPTLWFVSCHIYIRSKSCIIFSFKLNPELDYIILAAVRLLETSCQLYFSINSLRASDAYMRQ